jgi:hypothetical protein
VARVEMPTATVVQPLIAMRTLTVTVATMAG